MPKWHWPEKVQNHASTKRVEFGGQTFKKGFYANYNMWFVGSFLQNDWEGAEMTSN